MASTLTPDLVRRARMISLLLATGEHRTPQEVVRWFGAMQAQDAASGHWSLGVRCHGSTEADVLAAFERREIVRTWPMRGTIHLVPARDVRWLLDLTGVRALSGSIRRREQLGLRASDADRAAAVLDAALSGGTVATRRECLEAIGAEGIDTSGQRGYHLLWFAAQVGVTCIGPQRGTDQTFVRLADWAPRQAELTREEALAELHFRFVRSHGPVSLRDFAGWSGLTLTDARAAATANAGRIGPVTLGGDELWCTADLAEAISEGLHARDVVVALPGFDEFLLGYKDRSLHLPPNGMELVVPGGNGVFRSTIAVNGEAVATWTRIPRARIIDISVEPFTRMTERQRAAAERSLRDYARFLDREPHIRYAEQPD